MTLVLDSGALIAFERGDRVVAARIEAARRRRDRLVTSSGCIVQVWRGGPRQSLLARLLRGVHEHALHPKVSRAVGALCAKAGLADVVDAHVALLATHGDTVLTSDPADLQALLRTAGVRADLLAC